MLWTHPSGIFLYWIWVTVLYSIILIPGWNGEAAFALSYAVVGIILLFLRKHARCVHERTSGYWKVGHAAHHAIHGWVTLVLLKEGIERIKEVVCSRFCYLVGKTLAFFVHHHRFRAH